MQIHARWMTQPLGLWGICSVGGGSSMRAGSIASHTWRWLELAASKRLVGQESGDFGLLFQGQSGTPERGIFATHTHTHTQHTQNNTTVLTPLILT